MINITAIFESIKSFFVAHKALVIGVAAAVAIGGTAVGLGVASQNKSSQDAPTNPETSFTDTGNDESSLVSSELAEGSEDATENLTEPDTSDSAGTGTESSEEASDIEPSEALTDEPTTEAPTTAPTEAPTSEPTTETPTSEPTTEAPTTAPTEAPTEAPTAAPFTEPTSSNPAVPSTGPWARYVQDADLDTLISWDGVSPILFTYPDGTTGYEKRAGATYEKRPFDEYVVPEETNDSDSKPYDGTCKHCGRVEGDGSNGTCLYYINSSKTYTCENCGVQFPGRTCHTCAE